MPEAHPSRLPLAAAAFAAGALLGAGALALLRAPAAPASAEPPHPAPAPAAQAPVETVRPAVADSSMPVALVGGAPITLRQVEDALLRKEGSEELLAWITLRLGALDWERMPEHATLLAIAGAELTRSELAGRLLTRSAGGPRDALAATAREDLINIAVVERGLRLAGITLDRASIDSEYQRMETRFQAERERKGEPRLKYEDYLRTAKGQNLDQFKAQVGFRMLAGLHALVLHEARRAVDDVALRAWFDAHRERYDVTEAVDLSTIFIPYQAKGAAVDGKPVVTEEEREGKMSLFIEFAVRIRKGTDTYENIWRTFARSWERTGEGGRLGWIGRDGRRSDPKDRPLPRAAVDEAFAHVGRLPTVLMPVASDLGVDLVRVNAYRKAYRAEFAAVRDQVIEDQAEDELDQRTQALLQRLRAEAVVEYRSLPEALRARTGR